MFDVILRFSVWNDLSRQVASQSKWEICSHETDDPKTRPGFAVLVCNAESFPERVTGAMAFLKIHSDAIEQLIKANRDTPFLSFGVFRKKNYLLTHHNFSAEQLGLMARMGVELNLGVYWDT